MARDTRLTTILLHQVQIGQSFYCARSDRRTWTRLCPAGATSLLSDSVLVQRGRLYTHMNGMAHVWVRADPSR